MLIFKKLLGTEDFLPRYFDKTKTPFCDLSVGVRYMWREKYKVEYAIFRDTLILKETNDKLKDGFYYPIGKDVLGAIEEIENYCVKKRTPLTFCYLTEEETEELSEKYPFFYAEFDRDWSDYIYDAESFCTFSGKSYGGQRNHVNKFKKTYPSYRFRSLSAGDEETILSFLEEHKKTVELWDDEKKEEEKLTVDYVKKAFSLGQVAGGIFVNNKLVGVSIGERVGDTLIVHIEKAIKDYEGIYPTLANEFAKAFCGNAKKINREEDCGEQGLRISKLQYHPIEIKNKYVLHVKTAEENVKKIKSVTAGELKIATIKKTDADAYFRLYTDDAVNKYYGYDYRDDFKGAPTKEYFYSFQKNLKKAEGEYSFAVKKDGEMLGELVAYNFSFDGSCEIGFRFFKEFWGHGYAFLSITAFIRRLKSAGVRIVKAKALKENDRSMRLLNRLGLSKVGADEKYVYFRVEL